MENKENESTKNPDENDRTTEVVEIDQSEIPEVEPQREDLIDYEKHRLQPCKIEKTEIVRMYSKFAVSPDNKQHKLRILGKVVEVVEKEGHTPIQIRPSEIIGMIEDKEGKLLGLPDSEDSGWSRLKKAVGGEIKSPKDLIGKELPMRIKDGKNNSKFLGFFY